MHPLVRHRVVPRSAAVRGATLGVAVGVLVLSGCTALTGGGGGSTSGTAPSAAGPAATSSSGGSASSVPTTATSSATPTLSPAEAHADDVAYAQLVLLHQEQALDLADFALHGHGASAPVRELATEVESSATSAVAETQGWLTGWHAPAQPPERLLRTSGILTEQQLHDLAAMQGPAFDTRWATLMTAHDQAAVKLAESVVKTSQARQVKSFAGGALRDSGLRLPRLAALAR